MMFDVKKWVADWRVNHDGVGPTYEECVMAARVGMVSVEGAVEVVKKRLGHRSDGSCREIIAALRKLGKDGGGG